MQERINNTDKLIFIVKSISDNLNIDSEFKELKKIKYASRTEYTTVRAVANIAKKKIKKFISLIINISKIRSLKRTQLKMEHHKGSNSPLRKFSLNKGGLRCRFQVSVNLGNP